VVSLLTVIVMGEIADAQCYRTYTIWLQQKLPMPIGRPKAKSPLKELSGLLLNN
jgi:hypothetical protein